MEDVEEPTEEPTAEPTEKPTEEPTVEPTIEPTEEPTEVALTCPEGFTLFDDQCYRFYPESKTWNDAAGFCTTLGMILFFLWSFILMTFIIEANK